MGVTVFNKIQRMYEMENENDINQNSRRKFLQHTALIGSAVMRSGPIELFANQHLKRNGF